MNWWHFWRCWMKKVMPKIEFFIVCDYIPDTNIKNSRLWQQQFLQVQRTSSQRFVSISPTKESSSPHHSTTGSMPLLSSNSPISKSTLSLPKWPNTFISHLYSKSFRLLLPKGILSEPAVESFSWNRRLAGILLIL